jgi:outer membrane lipoprotein-sorting protein
MSRLVRIVFAAVALSATAASVSAHAAVTVDEIIAKNIKARGGMDKLKGLQTLRMSGKMQVQGIEAPFTIEVKRPKRLRMEFTIQGMTGIQALDGEGGWTVLPFIGKKDPERMSADDVKQAEEQADLDGPLVDYKAKGHKVELVGKEKVEGSDAWKLKVTQKNGDVHYLFLDADAYLEIKDVTKRTVNGNEVEIESTSGDYKDTAGLMFPHSIETGGKGVPQRVKLTFSKIEVNPKIEDTRFKMPAAAAPAAPADKKAAADKKPAPAEKK